MPSHATAFALSTPARLYGLALHRWQDSNLQLTDLESAHILQYAAPILKAAVHQRCLYLSDMLSMQTPRRPFGLTGDLLPRGIRLGSLSTCRVVKGSAVPVRATTHCKPDHVRDCVHACQQPQREAGQFSDAPRVVGARTLPRGARTDGMQSQRFQ